MKNIAAFFAILLVTACTDDVGTTRTLKALGYKDIVITGYDYSPVTCGEHQPAHTGFTATNIANQKVSGVVCCGPWVDTCTMRLY